VQLVVVVHNAFLVWLLVRLVQMAGLVACINVYMIMFCRVVGVLLLQGFSAQKGVMYQVCLAMVRRELLLLCKALHLRFIAVALLHILHVV
jgi:hypothetical protein